MSADCRLPFQVRLHLLDRLYRDVLFRQPAGLEPASPDSGVDVRECYADGVTFSADQTVYLYLQATDRSEPFCPGCMGMTSSPSRR